MRAFLQSMAPTTAVLLLSTAAEAQSTDAPEPSSEAVDAAASEASESEPTAEDGAESEDTEEAAEDPPAVEEGSGELDESADASGEADAPSEGQQTSEAQEASAEPAEPAPQDDGADSSQVDSGSEEVEDDYAGATDAALVPEKESPGDLSLSVTLDLTLPLGEAAEFINRSSIQGLSLDVRYYAFGNVGLGIGVGLDSLSKKSTETVTWDNATITGTQVREQAYTPILFKGYYAWRDQERFVPYVAAGVGAARSVRRLVVGFSSLQRNSWHFAAAPELGLQIPTGPTMLLTNVRLNYLPPSSGVDAQVFANFSLGLTIQ